MVAWQMGEERHEGDRRRIQRGGLGDAAVG